ncbi:MAG TPA: GNAT family N-acetyltransferase [Solirubrobacteraceae bacterium]|nr:GNAT family N-acetyltransferase [Solirubrobacteraceae bacterium]
MERERITIGSATRGADEFRPLWDAVTDHHAGLRTPDANPAMPTWESERKLLSAALGGGGRGFVVVAERSDELTGYARVEIRAGGLTIWPPVDRVGTLETLSVEARVRGEGIGRTLIGAVVSELGARRVPVVFVSLWWENVGARRFYERCGFRADARGRYRRSCP